MRIGIIGLGFVGSAIRQSYDGNESVELLLLDPYKGYVCDLAEMKDADAIFVCVPSPQNTDGSCDTRILESVLESLENINYKNVIISKVTAPPNVYDGLQEKYINLVHVPEFLTADNAVSDYINGKFLIIGGNPLHESCLQAEVAIRQGQKQLEEVRYCSIGEASLCKYVINCFLATKVIFMNEIKDIADSQGYDYNILNRLFTLDKRIGDSHTKVPGPDGKVGFGGYCFPKDTSALLRYSGEIGIDLSILKSAVWKNYNIRKY